MLADLVGERANRRHRPGRGFEALRYRFEIVSDYGAFRDLQRHRMLTVQWQPLTPDLGAEVPEEVVAGRLRRRCTSARWTAPARSTSACATPAWPKPRRTRSASATGSATCWTSTPARRCTYGTALRPRGPRELPRRRPGDAHRDRRASTPRSRRRCSTWTTRPSPASSASWRRSAASRAARAAHRVSSRAKRSARGRERAVRARSSRATRRRCARCTTAICAGRPTAATCATATPYIAGNTEGDLVWRAQRLTDAEVVVAGDTAVLDRGRPRRVRARGRAGRAHMRLTLTWTREEGAWRVLAGARGLTAVRGFRGSRQGRRVGVKRYLTWHRVADAARRRSRTATAGTSPTRPRHSSGSTPTPATPTGSTATATARPASRSAGRGRRGPPRPLARARDRRRRRRHDQGPARRRRARDRPGSSASTRPRAAARRHRSSAAPSRPARRCSRLVSRRDVTLVARPDPGRARPLRPALAYVDVGGATRARRWSAAAGRSRTCTGVAFERLPRIARRAGGAPRARACVARCRRLHAACGRGDSRRFACRARRHARDRRSR